VTRRAAAAALLWTLLSLVAGATSAAPVGAVVSVGITVSDLDRSTEFYTRVLGFEKVSEVEVAGADLERLQGVFGARVRIARLKLGEEVVELTEYLAPRGRPIPADARSNDGSFQHVAIVVSDMERAYAWLRRHRVTHASSGPQRIPDSNPAAGGIRAFYFKDPDAHTLEVIWFPPGKGDRRWQEAGGRLFLGVDHTAIVTADTDRSLRFWRDALGMRVVGESENHGTEQEHLNNVFGARLRITGLRAARGPGVELLEYLAPRDGRPYPADARANDLVHWQTRLATADVQATLERIPPRARRYVSPGVVEVQAKELRVRRGALLRDPDAHAVLLAEP
jgi:catechol 2,3-dioxygenase-like lactoylglutathione lyase family enzyme